EGRTILVHGSAGFVPGALAGRHADVVYLGAGGLGRQDAARRGAYWKEVVEATGARRAVLIHWDDFFLPLSRPLAPLPPLADDLAVTMADLSERAARDHVDLRIGREWAAADPFAGLPARSP